jgi:hypothetical protein
LREWGQKLAIIYSLQLFKVCRLLTPSSAQSALNQLNSGKLNGRQVIANFEGGESPQMLELC